MNKDELLSKVFNLLLQAGLPTNEAFDALEQAKRLYVILMWESQK